MSIHEVPSVFLQLQSNGCICENDLVRTQDGFWMLRKSLAEILAVKGILDFPDTDGERLACDSFYDDWFMYAVPGENECVYSLLKLREQEHDAEGDAPSDGDTPGVTVSFVPFSCEALLICIEVPVDANRLELDCEIDRVVARRGQRYHKALKAYFINPKSEGAYLVADQYVKHIASFSQNGVIDVPKHYGEISKNRKSELPSLIECLNQAAGRVVCDHGKIYFQNTEEPTEHERRAVLATHTGNTSVYSFAAEVEYHARFLTPAAKIGIPFRGKSLYESAIRADMTIDGAERRSASYYREGSKILQRQYRFHKNYPMEENI